MGTLHTLFRHCSILFVICNAFYPPFLNTSLKYFYHFTFSTTLQSNSTSALLPTLYSYSLVHLSFVCWKTISLFLVSILCLQSIKPQVVYIRHNVSIHQNSLSLHLLFLLQCQYNATKKIFESTISYSYIKSIFCFISRSCIIFLTFVLYLKSLS